MRKKVKRQAKRRNPQDATLRNIRALRKQIEKLERRMEALILRAIK